MKPSILRPLTRTNWLKIHLYLAISAGFFFALIGLTGSISLYREEIDGLLNPQLIIENPQGKYQSLDKIMASVHAAHPTRYGSWTLEMPSSTLGMITAWYEKPTETFFELYAPLMVSVNPYTSEIVMTRFWGKTFTTYLLDLHTQFRLARFGWNAVGILGALLFISCASGLYLWWPGIKAINQVLKVRHKAGMMLFAFDIHRSLGLINATALLLLAFTGFFLSYPILLDTLTGSSGMEHGQTGRTITSAAVPNNHPTGLQAASFIAQGAFPKAKLRRLSTPIGDTGVYRINLRQASEINQRYPFTTVWVDRWSGQVKEVRNPNKFTLGETFASWIWPLHTGEAIGKNGKFFLFLAGLSLFMLYVSGLIRWLCRIGLVQDRKVSFKTLHYLLSRLSKITNYILLKIYILIRLLTQSLFNFFMKAYAISLIWIKKKHLLVINKQKQPQQK
jgi:uncharacterized iron-regulated membrane protein